jgi:hypothetical protein
MDRDTFLALASALEDIGRAPAVARGAQRNSGQFYQTLADAGNKREERALEQERLKQEAVRQKVLDDYKAKDEARAQAKFEAEQAESERKNKMQYEYDDPNSEMSRTTREIASQVLPGRDLSKFSAAQLNSIMPPDKILSLQEQRKTREQAAREAAEAKRMALEERQREKQTAAETKVAEKKEARFEGDVNKLSNTYDKSGVPSAAAVIQNVDALVPKDGDIPGYGRVAGMLPDFAVSQKGEDVRQAISQMFNIELKDRSGAAVTDQELNRLKREFGEGSWKSDDQLRKGIAQYKARLQQVIKNIEAGFKPEIIQEYRNRQGVDFASSISGGNQPSKIRVSNGTETLEIDPADEAEAAAEGFRRLP